MPGRSNDCGVGEAGAERDGSGALVDQHLAELDLARKAIDEPSGSFSRTCAEVGTTPPWLSARRRASRSAADSWMSTKTGSSRVIVVSGIGLVRGDERAFGDVREPDPAGDRRRHPREALVDLALRSAARSARPTASACRAWATALV